MFSTIFLVLMAVGLFIFWACVMSVPVNIGADLIDPPYPKKSSFLRSCIGFLVMVSTFGVFVPMYHSITWVLDKLS